MDIKEFWDNYLNKDITTITDLVIDFFNQELQESIGQEYELGEVITEFVGHHERAKKYDEIERFGEVIKNRQPKLYAKEGDFINEALIKYYCFKNDGEKLKEQVKAFISRDYDYDILLQGFNQLLYNQHVIQVNRIIEQEYENVKNSSKLIEGAEFDLAIVKYYIELEKIFSQHKEKKFDNEISLFRKKIYQYGFNFNDQYCKQIEIGLFNDSEVDILDLLKEFPKDRSYIMATIEMQFLKLMQSKNCPFPIGGMIWYNLFQYFEDHKARNWKNYFTFKKSSFNKFLNSRSGFFIDNRIETALLIWGSSYFVDFIYQNQIILNDKYLDQKKLLNELKNEFKESSKFDLWEYNFIHKWEREENTSLDEWKREIDEFESSYKLEFDHYEFEESELDQLIEDLLFEEVHSNEITKPHVSLPKIGRNEKINVRYRDGTIKKDIKYKKVMNDIRSGDCEII